MDTQGLWQLFLQTGQPLVWLALRQEESRRQEAYSAFVPTKEKEV